MSESHDILSREGLVASLRRLGISEARAEAEADRRFGPRVDAIQLKRDEAALEKAEQAEVIKVYRSFGCVVKTLSQPRATRQSPGLPDLRVFAPRIRRFWDHETKRQKGSHVDPAQRDYAELAATCGLEVVIGDRFAAGEQLVRVGLAVREGDRLEPVRVGLDE
jgi:hypothetical protein